MDSRSYGTCDVTRKECRLYYSVSAGYNRYCSTSTSPCPEDTVKQPSGAADSGVSAPIASPPPVLADTVDRGAAALPDARRFSAFDIACTRDSQCGPGKCNAGECFYGCQSDAQCGSGDRCSVESGTRICLPDPNPPVQCTRTAQCASGMLCLNGSCRQICSETEECTNLLDRCGSGVCQPDRRPLGQCVLNEECPAGSVCLDGACVDACAGTPDGGVCLAPRSEPSKPVSSAPPSSGLSGVEPRPLPLADAGPAARGTDANNVPAAPVGSEPVGSASTPTPVEPVSSAPVPPALPPVEAAPVSGATDPVPVSTETEPTTDEVPAPLEPADAGASAL